MWFPIVAGVFLFFTPSMLVGLWILRSIHRTHKMQRNIAPQHRGMSAVAAALEIFPLATEAEREDEIIRLEQLYRMGTFEGSRG